MTKFSVRIAALTLIAATTGASLAQEFSDNGDNTDFGNLAGDSPGFNFPSPIDIPSQLPPDGPYMQQAPDYPVDPGCGMECAPEFIEAPEPVDPPEIVFD